MAKSGKLTWTTEHSSLAFNFDWQVVSQDVASNTSTISFTFSTTDKGGRGTVPPSIPYDYPAKLSGGSLIIRGGAGNPKSFGVSEFADNAGTDYAVATFYLEPNGTVTWLEDAFALKHDSYTEDETFEVVFYTDVIDVYSTDTFVRGSYSYKPGDVIQDRVPQTTYVAAVDRIEAWATLDTVPATFTDEDSPSIGYTNNAGTLATLLQAGISITNNHTSPEIAYRNLNKTSNTYTFTLTAAEKSVLYAAVLDKKRTTTSAKIYVKSTVFGETKYSYKDVTINFINYAPELNITLKDTNEISLRVTGNDQIFIRGVSNVEYDLGISLKKGAKIGSFFIQNGDQVDNTRQVNTFNAITDNVFYAHVMDNRNHSDSEIIEKNIATGEFVDYFPLTCSLKTTYLDGTGNLPITVVGKYFAGNFGLMNNSLTMEYRIYKDGEDAGSWLTRGKVNTLMDIDDDFNYTYSFNISNLDYTSRYVLEVRAVDEVMTQPAVAYTVVAARPIFDWGANDFAFHVPVTIQDNTVPTLVESGLHYSGWNYRKWSDGTSECWISKDFSVNVTSAWGSMYTSGAISGSNLSFPSNLFIATPNIQASLLVRSAGGILMAPGGAGANIASKSQTGVYEIARGTSLSGAAYTINYYARGNWK